MRQKSNFCPLPFSSIALNSTGVVTPCCVFSQNEGLSVDQYSHADSEAKNFQWVTELFSKEASPIACRSCYIKENRGLPSKRTKNLTKLKPLSTSPAPYYFDLHFSNLCNLQCATCMSQFSSQWIDFDKKNVDSQFQRESHDLFKPRQGKRFVEKMVNDIKIYLQTPQEVPPEISALGGEPFMSKEFRELLRTLDREDLLDKVKISVTTNATLHDEELMTLIEGALDSTLCLSIDATGLLFNYVRGGDWHQVTKNIDTFKKYDIKRFFFFPTFSLFNFFSISDLLRWYTEVRNSYESLGRKTRIRFTSSVSSPSYTSFLVLPKEIRQEVTVLNEVKSSLSEIELQELKSLLEALHHSPRVQGIERSVAWIKEIDRIRNMKFFDLAPDYLIRHLESVHE
jgi:organic radical activating enzyme